MKLIRVATIGAALVTTISAQASTYHPCPLLGPFVPPPRIDPASPSLQSAMGDFQSYIESYIKAGDGDFGPIKPNTTNFNIALFAGSNYVAGDDAPPYFFNFSHTPAGMNNASIDIGSQVDMPYPIGDVTQLFTVYTLLAELGDDVWDESIGPYLDIPAADARRGGINSSINPVDWQGITLGALAGHMAGIVRDSHTCRVDEACDQDLFFGHMQQEPRVYLPDTTPVYSNAAFQVLAFALEWSSGGSYENTLIKPLGLDKTGLLAHPGLPAFNIANSSSVGEPAALGLYSSIRDLSKFGRSILTSSLLTPAQTRRWLKPISSTSNLRNSVGRPWEIYHYSKTPTDPIIDIYTKLGTIGNYSSYFGLVPAYDIGFAILAQDDTGAPDLNAYADMALVALGALDKLARAQANNSLAGTFTRLGEDITVQLTGEDAGLAVTEWFNGDRDVLGTVAHEAGIASVENLDLRLYPKSRPDLLKWSTSQFFQGVLQDKSALVDAGTPTCISWKTVGLLPLKDFRFEMDGDGKAQSLIYAGLKFERKPVA
ncbi:hypothetical protein LTR56_010824 [Elasticomyces elasticus]|nr:hypothetical protein LTR56_010824 [Elasticomyces elasticus]KAK3650302.1 hypothetical protein LTR22_012629 [Elasticomyces elasticus]KAK4932313.1 hypothetical protein LTR49_001182 [Elasticomyces elasticus]KAK5768321.1 hypothetical protein LTS12_001460 [Elasticomyces elasticus]